MSEHPVDILYRRRGAGEFGYALFSIFGSAAGFALGIAIAIAEQDLAVFYIALFAVTLLFTGVGVSLGLHRLFSHHSFVPTRALKITLAIAGVSTGQGYFFRWVNEHHLHHRHSDQPGDPHSPYFVGTKPISGLTGFIHSHCGWLLTKRVPFNTSNFKRIANDQDLTWIDRNSITITILSILLPGLLSLFYEASGSGFVKGCIWGGFARIFVLNHITWSVNSFGHLLGHDPFPNKKDHAKNNALLGLLAFGDGWHANHHAVPVSARHGNGHRQFDFNYMLLLVFAKLGWVKDIKVPKPKDVAIR